MKKQTGITISTYYLLPTDISLPRAFSPAAKNKAISILISSKQNADMSKLSLAINYSSEFLFYLPLAALICTVHKFIVSNASAA